MHRGVRNVFLDKQIGIGLVYHDLVRVLRAPVILQYRYGLREVLFCRLQITAIKVAPHQKQVKLDTAHAERRKVLKF